MVGNLDKFTVREYPKMLFPYAYNILRVIEDAEDAVQEVLFKYFSCKREGIDSVKAYLVKSVINQSIEIKKKRKRFVFNEVVGVELIAAEGADTNINLREGVSYALLILLQNLNRRERAVFILKEGFDYSHREIADLLSCTVEQSRQLLSRGKNKLNVERKLKATGGKLVDQRILNRYINIVRYSETGGLENLLSVGASFLG